MKLKSLFLCLALAGCSSAGVQPEATTESTPSLEAAESTPPADSLLAENNTPPPPAAPETTPSDLATPVDIPPPESIEAAKPESPALPEIAQTETPSLPPPAAAPIKEESPKTPHEVLKEYQEREAAESKSKRDREIYSWVTYEGGSFQIGFDTALNAYSDYSYGTAPNLKKFSTLGFKLSYDYFPITSLGRFGLGVDAGFFWKSSVSSKSYKNAMSAYGGRATYEFQYWIGQLVVPFGFIGYDQVSVAAYSDKINDPNTYSNSRTFGSQNYGGGLRLNLNRLESGVASSAFVNTGIRKFYLSYALEMHQDVANSGRTHLLGLRFEY